VGRPGGGGHGRVLQAVPGNRQGCLVTFQRARNGPVAARSRPRGAGARRRPVTACPCRPRNRERPKVAGQRRRWWRGLRVCRRQSPERSSAAQGGGIHIGSRTPAPAWSRVTGIPTSSAAHERRGAGASPADPARQACGLDEALFFLDFLPGTTVAPRLRKRRAFAGRPPRASAGCRMGAGRSWNSRRGPGCSGASPTHKRAVWRVARRPAVSCRRVRRRASRPVL
jgi:hypothetical protein